MARQKSLTPEQLAAAADRYAAGDSLREIATDCGVSKTGLGKMLNGHVALRAKTARPKCMSPEAFVRVWQQCQSVREVAAKTGLKASIIYMRAKSYRDKGVRLKRFEPRRGKKVNVDELNALIDSLAEVPATTTMGDI